MGNHCASVMFSTWGGYTKVDRDYCGMNLHLGLLRVVIGVEGEREWAGHVLICYEVPKSAYES